MTVFHQEDEKVVSDSPEVEYRTTVRFRKLLATLPDDEIPQAVVLLGILTEQLRPVDGDKDQHVQVARDKIKQVPSAEGPEQTIKAVMWLLNEVKSSLDRDRKETVGELISQTGLDSPTVSTNQPSNQAKDQKDNSRSVETNTTGNTDASKTSSVEEETRRKRDQTSSEGNSGQASDSTKSDLTNRSKNTRTATDDTFECEFCQTKVQSKSDLISHSIYCDERPKSARFQCQYCGNKYISKQALSNHLNSCDEIDNTAEYSCEDCNERFDSVSKLLEHQHSCRGSRTSRRSQSTSQSTTVEKNYTGAVVHYNSDDGYGFISSAGISSEKFHIGESEDIFFHISKHPDKRAKEGQRLRFDIKNGEDGPVAVNIRHTGPSQTETWDDKFASKRPRWGQDS